MDLNPLPPSIKDKGKKHPIKTRVNRSREPEAYMEFPARGAGGLGWHYFTFLFPISPPLATDPFILYFPFSLGKISQYYIQ